MKRNISSILASSAALISVVNASIWWPEGQQNTQWQNNTTPAPTITTPVQTGQAYPQGSLELGTNTVAAYDPASITTPDLSQATSLAAPVDGSDCSIFAGNVNVYYFNTVIHTNTDCFTGSSVAQTPPAITNPVFPSVYVVISSLSAGNSHTSFGSTYSLATFSMLPEDLSTIAGQTGPTEVFNFADLPCPPSDIATADSYFYNTAINPGRAYMPRIVPPSQILLLDPAWASCTFPQNFQFFDPPSPFPSAWGDQGPGGGGPAGKRDVQQAPQAMITPPPAPIEWHRGHPRQVARDVLDQSGS